MQARSSETRKTVTLAIFTGIIFVLQLIATFIRFGPFSITLALAPIIIGAAIFGPKAGAYLGGVLGVVVLVACVLGWDGGGAMLWNAQPFLTALVCLGKGILSGLAAGIVYRLVSAKNIMAGAIAAGVASPIVNTGIFLLGLYFLFPDFLAAWATAAGADIATYVLTVLVGVNFILELCVNLVLSTVIVRVIKARMRM